MSAQVVIDERFNGPPGVANGGYACATVAGALDGPAATTLLQPVPVATPLVLDPRTQRATLHSTDGQLLAEAVPVDSLDEPTPEPVTLDEARAAMRRYPARDWGARMFPCFVCGPDRADGFGVFPGPVPGRDVAAAVWRTDRASADGDGQVPDELCWAVLDCTGSWAAMIHNGLQTGALLGRMTARILAPPDAGASYVTVGWAGARDGRKLPAGAALFTEDGDLVAQARLLCVEPRPR